MKKKIRNFLVIVAAALSVACVICKFRSPYNIEPAGLEVPEIVKEPPVLKEPVDIPENRKPKKAKRFRWVLKKRFTVKLYTTCYTGYDKGDPGHGKYANNKFADKLHRAERRIQRHHYTCALPPELKEYHETLVYFRGRWTHKFRCHIPGYNTDTPNVSDIDGDYFSVPRDRMKQKGRIDCLITTAGKYNSLEQRVRNWGSTVREIEFWELVREEY